MKIILSRKGFDGTYGGIPSPILEDGTVISFPIPADAGDGDYDIRYKDLNPYGNNLGQMIEELGTPLRRNSKKKNTAGKDDLVHLDPDLVYDILPDRHKDWRGLLGQCAAAQGHLRNQTVGIGDLFLFYGLYQHVKKVDGRFVYDRTQRPVHMIWGWLQVGDILDINEEMETGNYKYPWVKYHQHYHFGGTATNNALYVASKELAFNGFKHKDIKGYGVFDKYDPKFILTDPDDNKLSYWRLPGWMYTGGECPISYNKNRKWELKEGYARLQSYPRAQEYVLDISSYPEAKGWLSSFFI